MDEWFFAFFIIKKLIVQKRVKNKINKDIGEELPVRDLNSEAI